MKILIILGSTREGRRGDKVAAWVVAEAKKIKGVTFEYIDLRDYCLPFYEEPMHPSMLHGKCDDKSAEKWIAKVKSADGYLIVTPEYNHSYPAVLKNAMDYPYDEWNNKPIGFVSYGGLAGGARAVEQLRLVAIELQMAPIQAAVLIPAISQLVNEQGFMSNERFTKTLKGVFDQLLWWVQTLKRGREKATK